MSDKYREVFCCFLKTYTHSGKKPNKLGGGYPSMQQIFYSCEVLWCFLETYEYSREYHPTRLRCNFPVLSKRHTDILENLTNFKRRIFSGFGTFYIRVFFSMQPCRSLPRLITPNSLLEDVSWSITEPSCGAHVYVDRCGSESDMPNEGGLLYNIQEDVEDRSNHEGAFYTRPLTER